jgi:hypothetical protein
MFSVPLVHMLLPQVRYYLISITKSSSIAFKAFGNKAEVKSLSGCVNRVLVAGVFIVVFKAFSVAGLGIREA